MKLDTDLARKIVKKTMDVLGKNINIMNEAGIIIGSGDPERLNTFHEIARQVIIAEKAHIVEEEEVDYYQGVRPGLNLPICFHGRVIGVVGITGRVEEVGGYGELVKNMVELILQQEFLREEMELENRSRENFFQQLLSEGVVNKDLLQDRAELLKISVDLYRVVFVCKLASFTNKEITKKIQYLNQEPYINQEDLLMSRGNHLVLIKSLDDCDPDLRDRKKMEVADRIKKVLEKEFVKISVGVGQVYYGLDKLHLSYRGAKHALQVGERIYRKDDKKVFYLNRLGYDYFLPFIKDETAKYYLHHLFDHDIAQIFADTDIGEIIEKLVENDLNYSKTANSLHIHRNTLLYKLNKIEKMTGLNPGQAADLFSLLWAYHLYLFHGELFD